MHTKITTWNTKKELEE